MESVMYMANVITAANLLFGVISIFLSVMGKYVPAAWIIFFSIAFDIADGKIARMGTESSEFGRQFDSLADLVSFIVAPAILILALRRPEFFLWRLLVCLIAVFCGAFRLARFNTESEEKRHLFFVGLPSPAFGAMCASLVLILYRYNLHVEPRIISIFVALLAMMMVSRVQYPTFKNVPLLQRKYVIGFMVVLILTLIVPEISAFIVSALYVVLMPIKAILMKGAEDETISRIAD
ncbi:CDP-diacylglycerol--serine O-phosphatidyltransferase [Candidatus Omnitrophota bacterium]